MDLNAYLHSTVTPHHTGNSYQLNDYCVTGSASPKASHSAAAYEPGAMSLREGIFMQWFCKTSEVNETSLAFQGTVSLYTSFPVIFQNLWKHPQTREMTQET
jgi:hypothetical protein